MNEPLPAWVDALTAVLVLVGALAALIGSLGLVRLRTFFQRVHAPTLGATVGTWCLTLALAAQISFARGQLYVHALLVSIFLAFTAPVTTLLLMRAALFRARIRREPGVPLQVTPAGPSNDSPSDPAPPEQRQGDGVRG